MKYLFAALLLALPAIASGQVYRWTDEAGRVHYGDKPPADRKAKAVQAGRPARIRPARRARRAHDPRRAPAHGRL
jgi:hypothetical protein